jgi:hypothetical protein
MRTMTKKYSNLKRNRKSPKLLPKNLQGKRIFYFKKMIQMKI